METPQQPATTNPEGHEVHKDIIDRKSWYATPELLWQGLKHSAPTMPFATFQSLRQMGLVGNFVQKEPPYANNFPLVFYDDEYFTQDPLLEETLLKPRQRLREAVMKSVPKELKAVREVFRQFSDPMLDDAKIDQIEGSFAENKAGLGELQNNIHAVYLAMLELVTNEDCTDDDFWGGATPSAHTIICR